MCDGGPHIPSRMPPFGAQMETEGIKKSLMKEADLGPDFKRQAGCLHIKDCSVPHQLGISLSASVLTLQHRAKQSRSKQSPSTSVS